jgi:uncharacterized membrane protein
MPAPPDPSVRTAHARIAARKRWHGPGADVAEVERDLRVARAAEYVRGLLDLPLDRRARLAAQLLAPGGEGA